MLTLELLKKELAVATLQQKLGKEVSDYWLTSVRKSDALMVRLKRRLIRCKEIIYFKSS